jgi:hypothetical protein
VRDKFQLHKSEKVVVEFKLTVIKGGPGICQIQYVMDQKKNMNVLQVRWLNRSTERHRQTFLENENY